MTMRRVVDLPEPQRTQALLEIANQSVQYSREAVQFWLYRGVPIAAGVGTIIGFIAGYIQGRGL